MGYHNLQKKKNFFEERKIYLLVSTILMVALRGADCGIFCKLKHFFITTKLCRKKKHDPFIMNPESTCVSRQINTKEGVSFDSESFCERTEIGANTIFTKISGS